MSSDWIVLIVEYLIAMVFFLAIPPRILNIVILISYSMFFWYHLGYDPLGGGGSFLIAFYAFFAPIVHIAIYLIIKWLVRISRAISTKRKLDDE